jgi:aryl-phospho-beta-D-glucosidase BglC (GH1 family)
MKWHILLLTLLNLSWPSVDLALAADSPPASANLPPAGPDKLPRWRGFNLLEKFQRDWNNKPFAEQDFRLIHELGFNFVRLPMDYRVWIEGDDWGRFREATLKEIDQAVQWGGKYGIHVCLNFHRAPGYTVASPPERTSLWTDAETQRVCARHWAMFALRYKGIPSERLSFNLFNEPAGVEAAAYVRVVRGIVAAIRSEDPQRLVISDGLQWGTLPVPELRELKIAQATRGYTPMELTHYKASWVGGADQYPLPTWPILLAYGTLYGSAKPELQAPLILDGPFARPARLRFRVGTVSFRCRLLVDADGKTLFEKDFVCGPGQGEWKKAVFKAEWNSYQNVYDRDYETAIPAGTTQVRLRVAEGDWMQIRQLGLKAEGDRAEASVNLLDTWGNKPAHLGCKAGEKGSQFTAAERMDRAWLREKMIRPWKEAEAKGIGVMVGEFGAFNQTPHDVTLAWMEDCLKNWKEAGWGWAMWNFRGSIGVLDSGRADVIYEDYQGHKLDRKMLELLKKY